MNAVVAMNLPEPPRNLEDERACRAYRFEIATLLGGHARVAADAVCVKRQVTTEAFVVFHLEAEDRLGRQLLAAARGPTSPPPVAVRFATIVLPNQSALGVLHAIDPTGFSAREVMTPLVVPDSIRVVVVAARGIGNAQMPPEQGAFSRLVRGGSA